MTGSLQVQQKHLKGNKYLNKIKLQKEKSKRNTLTIKTFLPGSFVLPFLIWKR